MTKTRILMHCVAAVVTTLAVSLLQIRPLGIFFIISLILWIYKTKCSASIEIIAPPDFHAYFLRVFDQFSKLRQDKPAVFCLILSGALGILAIIGHILSGSSVVLIGLILSALVSTKYNFKIVKAPKKQSYSWTEVADHDVDEFLPEVNESNLFVLERASDQAFITQRSEEDDEKNDEIPSELLIPDPIPEIDEKSDSSGEEDLLIMKSPVGNPQIPMEFMKGYFKKDSSISTSSSSDEENLSKGLKFPDYSVVDSKEQQRQIIPSVMSASLGSNITPLSLVSGFVSWTAGNQSKNKSIINPKSESFPVNKQNDADSSDESDFELISPDDLNNS